MINDKFPVHRDDFDHGRWSIRRYKFTVAFLKRFIPIDSTILDLGSENGLGNYMKECGYEVVNTSGEDFDFQQSFLADYSVDAVTAFEILEHLWNPLSVLRALPGKKLIISIPLRLWFAPPFKNKTNKAGWHVNEMTEWQIKWLIEKAGWKLIDYEKFTSPSFTIGFRTILRWITPRYFFAYCERK